MSSENFPGTPRSMSPSPSRRSVSFRVEKPILIACIGPTHAGRSSFTRTVAQLPQLRHSTTYCGSGIEEFVLNIDGQLVMLLDVPHLVEEDGDESEEARLLDEHIECAYKGRNHLSGLVMFSRITSRVPTLPLLCEGAPNSSFSTPPSLTLCTTSWHRIASTSTWGARREALLHTRFPGAAVTRFDAELPDSASDEAQQQTLEVLRLAMRTSERAPGSVARRPLQPRASRVSSHSSLPTPPTSPAKPTHRLPSRARRESIRSVASSAASSAADDVRSELMDVIEGLKAEVEHLRQAQEAQNSVKSRTRKRLSLASLRMI